MMTVRTSCTALNVCLGRLYFGVSDPTALKRAAAPEDFIGKINRQRI
jgi:hypothetical protein